MTFRKHPVKVVAKWRQKEAILADSLFGSLLIN
jgi:hypothetical protein